MKKDIAKLVKFGKGGDTVYFSAHLTSSGYGTPENPHAAVSREDRVISDGCPVIDTRVAVDSESGFRWVFEGPLCDVDLEDGAEDRLSDIPALMGSAMLQSGNEYGTMIAGQLLARALVPSAPGPLDSVSLRAYIAGWRAHGARIGRYLSGKIVWEI